MNEWYIENRYHIDNFFYNINKFILNNNISMNISINELYNKFIVLAFRGSDKPFKHNSLLYYRVRKKQYNSYYDFTLGSDFFDLIYDLKLYVQEYNQNFLVRLHTDSIQNFFENSFNINYKQKNETNNIDFSDDEY